MWEFAQNAPFIFFLIVWVVAWGVSRPFYYCYRAYKMRLRAQNIAKYGWPPAPLDADGDVVYPDGDDDL